MNKKIFSFIFFLISILTLTGCQNSMLEFLMFSNYQEVIQTKISRDEDNYYSFKEYSSLYLEYSDPTSQLNEIKTLSSLVASTNNGKTYKTIDSIGEVNILVIPISFLNSNKTNLDEKKIYIQNAFFGESSKNLNESLSSFYNKSSYGNLIIKGKVSDFYNLDMSAENLKNSYSSALNASRYVLNQALNWYKSSYDDINMFDNDKDGYIDLIYLIYDHPYSYDRNSLFWAYTDRINAKESIVGETINTSEPYASTYIWLSYDFINSNNNTISDSHVVNHEFGHALGLDDYYNDSIYQPLGYSDIMDCNLGDHNPYSKMALDWITPIVVKDKGKITIKTFQTSGECILIPIGDYNDTIFDEFLLLEYYSPTHLNYKDTLLQYQYVAGNNVEYISLFNQYGLKVYHVDARLAYVKNKNLNNNIAIVDSDNAHDLMEQYKSDCASEGIPFTYCLDFAFTNENLNHPFISLLSASNEIDFKSGDKITNDVLFQKDDSFNKDDFISYKGDNLNFSFAIENLNSLEATINFY